MDWYAKHSPNPKCIDLFCGAGGLSVGFDEAGFDVLAGIDGDKKAIETWQRNHNSGDGIVADLREISLREKLDSIGINSSNIDVIFGGPPCQDFSKCNQKIDLERNNLVNLFAEFVADLQPEAFLIENVRQLTSTHADVYESVLKRLEPEGYTINHRLLDAADYGVPQHRVRAFVIGIRDIDSIPRFPTPTHGPDSRSTKELITAGEALSDIPEPDNPEEYEVTSKHADLLTNIPPGMNYQFYTERMGHPEPEFEWRSRFSDYLYKADPDRPVRTLKAQPGAASGPFHWKNRRFTERELHRLQGFPDWYEFPHGYTSTVKQIGNSVPPPQAHMLALAIRRQIQGQNGLLFPEEKLNFRSRRRVDTSEYQRRAKEALLQIYDSDSLKFTDEEQKTLDSY